MRIRKNASKLLLGSASSVYSNPCPSPPATTTTAAADEVDGLVICELNRSPWDLMVMDPDPNYLYNNYTSLKEDEGILGNFIKTEEEEPISAISSNAAELSIKATYEKKARKMERKKSKGKEKAAAETIAYCRKSDGKGWHCKRPPQLPHTFCSYHLAQLRSYSSNHTKAPTNASASDDGKSHQTKAAAAAAAAAAAGVDSNLYYYYCGFGPLRGKRRSRAPDVNAAVKKEETGDSSRGSTVERDDNIIAGDDEYDLDCFDEDDDDDDNFSSVHQNNKKIGGKNEGDHQEKKRVEVKQQKKKKRGRKPIKARSLKSLL